MILNSICILTALYPSQAQLPNILTTKCSHTPPDTLIQLIRVNKSALAFYFSNIFLGRLRQRISESPY